MVIYSEDFIFASMWYLYLLGLGWFEAILRLYLLFFSSTFPYISVRQSSSRRD